MPVFTIDVWFSSTFPVTVPPLADTPWRRFRIDAPSATDAELAACQMTASHPGRTPIASLVIDW